MFTQRDGKKPDGTPSEASSQDHASEDNPQREAEYDLDAATDGEPDVEIIRNGEADESDADAAAGEPPTPPGESTSRGAPAKAGKKDAPRRRRSDKEVLQRLLEKNEVILQLTQKNTELDAQVKALADKRVRLMAEFENYRKRTGKEWSLLKEQTRAEVLTEFLPVVDDFERALAALGDRDDEVATGVRLIYNGMLTTLEKFGVRKMAAVGEPFDPNYHNAVDHIDSKDVKSNHVVEVIQEGYLMDGSVIRPANVVIAK